MNINWDGDCKNQLGSTMTLSVSGDKLTGTYQTAVGDEESISQPVPIIGTVDGDLIVFIAVYPSRTGDDNSICAWAGRYFNDKKGERIATVWNLVRRKTSKEADGGTLTEVDTEDWNHVLTNADVFTRGRKT